MKKQLSFILAAFLAASALLSACGGGGDANAPAQTGANVQSETTAAETEPDLRLVATASKEDAAALGLDGYKVNVYQRASWNAVDLYAEDQTGEALNDAVFNRNALLSDKFGFTVTQKVSTDSTKDIKDLSSLVLAGDDSIDCAFPSAQMAGTFAQEGTTVDLKTVKYIDFTSPQWDNVFNKTVELNGKLYMASGSITVNSLRATRVFYFSKSIHADNKLPDPYALVREGKWTVDELDKMAVAAARDLNGDGTMTWQDDVWGMAWQSSIGGMILYMASGEGIADKDAKGTPVLALSSDRANTAFNRAQKLISDQKTYFQGADADMKECFTTGHSLFYTETLASSIAMRDSDTDFGVLPCPMLDETQDTYIQYTDAWCIAPAVIPKSCKSPDRTGFVLQVLAETTDEFIMPVFYNIVLNGKTFRDEQSGEMLDIIARTFRLDLCEIYSWAKLNSLFKTLFTTSDSLATFVAANKQPFDAAVADTLKKFAETAG